MNPRLPYSAVQLQAEISEIDEDTSFEGDRLDGLGIYRALIATTPRARQIANALLQVAAIDRRITSVDAEGDVLAVTFPPDQIMESHARFGLRDMYDALAGDAEDEAAPGEGEAQSTEGDGPQEAGPPAKKTAARKRVAKKT